MYVIAGLPPQWYYSDTCGARNERHDCDAVCLKSKIHEIHEIQSLSRNPLSN